MAEEGGEWKSFWDLSSPEEAARTLRQFYGAAAAKAAADCAAAAQLDGRDEDCRFWTATLAEFNGEGANRGQHGAASAATTTVHPQHDNATHIGLLFDRSPEGLSTADELTANFPAINECLAPWRRSTDRFFVYFHEAAPPHRAGSMIARDLVDLVSKVLPEMFRIMGVPPARPSFGVAVEPLDHEIIVATIDRLTLGHH